jgi:hypothetical protein
MLHSTWLACVALLALAAVGRAAECVPSFLTEIEPLLTRQGCNQGACHGKGAGQNGFRLSLRGYAPEQDIRWLTREFGARRVIASVPEDSLLLRKATGQAPHEGGRLFSETSREYQTLLAWLRAGAPGPDPTEAKLTKLTLSSTNAVLPLLGRQPLICTAHFSDGSTRAVTWLTKFESNDPGQLAVTPAGVVQALRPGETAIRASYLGEVAVAIFSTPFEQPFDARQIGPAHNLIDPPVADKLTALRIPPAPVCDDATFVRRAMLDTIGRLPTPTEVRRFLADTDANKRTRLVDQLLTRPEFADYWALQLADVFQNRRERDHDVRTTKGVRNFHEWLRQQVVANRPWDDLARAVLTATGTASADDAPAVGYYIVTVGEQRHAERSEVVASVAQAFLGTRIGCAQCHNHPLERYTQDDYYHFAGFFARVKLQRGDPKLGKATTLVVSAPDANENRRPVGVIQPRTGQFLPPQPLDRSPTLVQPGDDPRRHLAEWMTNPNNEYFAGAMVNRIWRHYLNVGLVEPVDDLRATNPPSNPALWQALVQDFVRHKYDLRHLMRTILCSRTYQRSAATTPANAADGKYYSHYYARRLPAEVLLDAISDATGVPDQYPGYPVGLRAVQLPDPGLKSYFLSLFGKSERVTACACERNGAVTMPQLLHLQNGEAIAQKIRAGEGRLTQLLAAEKDDRKVVEELVLATLSRLPTEAEYAVVRQLRAVGDPRDEVFRDLVWALMNAKDFAFNR